MKTRKNLRADQAMQQKTGKRSSASGRWIRPADSRFASGEWLCFRHAFSLPAIPSSLRLRIACDTKYWLWVNGEIVLREGGLKHTAAPSTTYADEIDIGKFIHDGCNTVAVLVWYFGRQGFSHCDSGTPGLFIQQLDGGTAVSTGGAWRARRHPAFTVLEDSSTCYRLPESRFVFDSRNDLNGWTLPSYDDRTWPCAVVHGEAGSKPWGTVIDRPIPQFVFDTTISPYREVVEENGLRRCLLDACAQVHPYLKVRAPTGKRIQVHTDTVCLGGQTENRSMLFEYVTHEGEQEFECPAWISGMEVHYHIPAGVEVLALGYRRSGYLIEHRGSFWCSDELLSVLWRKSAATLLICMRDNYMDCPDRERTFFAGDVVNELSQASYVAGRDGNLMTRKGIREFMAWQREDKVLYAPFGGCWREELPQQSLALVGYYGVWTYYLHSGDLDTLRNAYPIVTAYLSCWDVAATGLVKSREGDMNWCDWGDNIDEKLLEQLWFALALKGQMLAAKALRKKSDADQFSDRLASLRAAIRNKCLRDGVFRAASYTGETDERANALAVLAGVVGPNERQAVVELLTSTRRASPYMERFVLEALFELGENDRALNRMRERYALTVASPYSTLYEVWEYQNPAVTCGTYNHAWSGCPAHLLPQYLANLRPLEPGWSRFSVRLQNPPGLLYSRVPLAQGDVEVRYESVSWQTMLWITVPPGTSAEWTPDYSKVKIRMKINGWLVIDNGKQGRLPPKVIETIPGDRTTLLLSPGHYTVEVF